MARYITKIRTDDGDHQIDYNALANLPTGMATETFVLTKIAEAQLEDAGIVSGLYATKEELQALSASDVGAVPTSRKVNGKALSDDIVLSASDVSARPNTWTPTATDVGARPNTWTPTASDVGAVPTSRTINGKALNSNITLSASDVSARPNTWTPTASDVGAAPSSHNHTKSQITDFPTSLPASDVYTWAKASSKPSYSWNEIGSKPSAFTPSSHTHDTSDITSGLLPLNRGGTGGWDAYSARNSLELPNFRTYFLEGNGILNILQANFSSFPNGCFVIYMSSNGSYVGIWGYKVDTYGSFMEMGYGGGNVYKYINSNGEWKEYTISPP